MSLQETTEPLQTTKQARQHGRLLCVLAAAIAFLAPGPQAHAAPPMTKLVIAPPGDGMRDLFEHPDAWAQARALTGSLLYADHNLTHLKDDDLKAWFAHMKTWNISLELEVGAIKEWGPTADATFAAEQPVWDRAIRLGATLGAVAMDEPLVASRALHKPDSYAVEQTARFIALVRQHYPGMRIGDVESYPGLPLEQHIAWLAQLQAKLHAQGLAPLDFYRADVDWVSFAKGGGGSWQGVAKLAAETRKAGVPFSLIYWASGYPSEKAEGFADDDTWYIEVMGQGYNIADTGLKPDQYVLESWLPTPARIVPEDQDYTFTRSVLDFGRKFVK